MTRGRRHALHRLARLWRRFRVFWRWRMLRTLRALTRRPGTPADERLRVHPLRLGS